MAIEDDVDACHRLLIADGRFAPAAELGLMIPDAWRGLAAANSAHVSAFVVWEEDASRTASGLAAFGLGLFVHDAFIDDALAAPQPYYAAEVYRAMREGRSPVLDWRQVAAANARGDLNLLIVHYVQREHDIHHPFNAALLPLGPAAWHFAYGGYQIKRVLWEAYGEQHRDYLLGGGFELVDDFADHASLRALEADRRPYWCLMERSKVRLAAFSANTLWIFNAPMPRLAFTPAQQRVALLALQGYTDLAAAQRLGVSTDAVRQAWDGIFERLPPDAGPILRRDDASRRGPERRRMALEYLRQNMQELRPFRAGS